LVSGACMSAYSFFVLEVFQESFNHGSQIPAATVIQCKKNPHGEVFHGGKCYDLRDYIPV
jgi:hypothetical protein